MSEISQLTNLFVSASALLGEKAVENIKEHVQSHTGPVSFASFS
jgi:hypothetical protein